MAKAKKEKGVIFDGEKPCPHCAKQVHIKIKRIVKTKAVPSKVEIDFLTL